NARLRSETHHFAAEGSGAPNSFRKFAYHADIRGSFARDRGGPVLAKINRPSLRWSPAAAAALLVLAAPLSTASAAPETPGAAKQSPGEPGKSRLRTLDVEGLGGGADACTDFYQYADAAWLARNPMPADRPRWGSFDELRLRNQSDLREILERLAADRTAAEGSDERKLGDFYGACMDEAAIEAKGA